MIKIKRTFLTPLCFIVLVMLAIPVVAAEDTRANVTPTETLVVHVTVTPTDTMTPVETVTPVDNVTVAETVSPVETLTPTGTPTPVETATPNETVTSAPGTGFDPVVSIAGAFGLRKKVYDERAANANLTGQTRDNQKEIHGNWWDKYNLFAIILGRHDQVKTDQTLIHENLTENRENRRQIHDDRADIRLDPGNASVYRSDINATRAEIAANRDNIASLHQDMNDVRNASKAEMTTIRENRQENNQIRTADNSTRQEVRKNHDSVGNERHLVRNDRGAKDSGS